MKSNVYLCGSAEGAGPDRSLGGTAKGDSLGTIANKKYARMELSGHTFPCAYVERVRRSGKNVSSSPSGVDDRRGAQGERHQRFGSYCSKR